MSATVTLPVLCVAQWTTPDRKHVQSSGGEYLRGGASTKSRRRVSHGGTRTHERHARASDSSRFEASPKHTRPTSGPRGLGASLDTLAPRGSPAPPSPACSTRADPGGVAQGTGTCRRDREQRAQMRRPPLQAFAALRRGHRCVGLRCTSSRRCAEGRDASASAARVRGAAVSLFSPGGARGARTIVARLELLLNDGDLGAHVLQPVAMRHRVLRLVQVELHELLGVVRALPRPFSQR